MTRRGGRAERGLRAVCLIGWPYATTSSRPPPRFHMTRVNEPPKYIFDEGTGDIVLNPEWRRQRASELTFNE